MLNLARLSWLALVPLWAGALWGSLQIHRLDLHLGHGLCGPWGCGPPLEAAIGYHLFWLAILLPPTVGLGLFLSRARNRKIGRILLFVATILTVGVVGYDVVSHAIQSRTAGYVFRRGLLTLVTTIDVPMMQLMAAGAALQFYFGRRPVVEATDIDSAEATEAPEAQGQFASGT